MRKASRAKNESNDDSLKYSSIFVQNMAGHPTQFEILSHESAFEFIGDMAEQLSAMARACHDDFLAYLLGLANQEAHLAAIRVTRQSRHSSRPAA
jgi:hypothetical protein